MSAERGETWPVAALGLDIGMTRTTVATGPVGTASTPELVVHTVPTAVAAVSDGWHHGSGTQGVARFLTGLLAGPDATVEPGRTALVVAVPDGWLTPTSAAPTAGMVLHRLLTDDLGFPSPRLVHNMLCVAAAQLGNHADTTSRIQLFCDIGAHMVTGAVCALDDRTVRLLDGAQLSTGEPGESAFHRALLDSLLAGRAAGPADRARLSQALDDERRRANRRAVLVLARAAAQPRYLGTPVYLPERDLPREHHGRLTADVVLQALTPLTAAARQVVERLMSRVAEPVHPEILVTGDDALPPVLDAVRTAAGGRDRRVRQVSPSAAARGAQRIAAGQVVAEDGYPHILGLALRRIRHGLLESATIPINAPDQPEPLIVSIEPNFAEPLPVRVRLHGEGPWLVVPPAATDSTPPAIPRVPPGTYRVAVLTGRSGLGALLLHPAGGGEPVIHLLAAAPGPAEEPPRHDHPGRNP